MITLSKSNIQNIILVSGDTDFIQVVKYVQDQGTRVYLWSANKDEKEIEDAIDASIEP